MKLVHGFFIFQKYGKLSSISLGHFIKHKPLICEECLCINNYYMNKQQHLATLFSGIIIIRYTLKKHTQHTAVLEIKSRLNLIFTRIMFKHKSCFKVFNDDTHFSSLYLFIRTINDMMECHYLWRPSTAEDDFLGPSNIAHHSAPPIRSYHHIVGQKIWKSPGKNKTREIK